MLFDRNFNTCWFTQVDGRIKMLLLCLALVLNLVAGGVRVSICLAVLSLGLLLHAGIRPRLIFKRMVLPMLLALLVLLSQLFWVKSGEVLSEIGLWSGALPFYSDGLHRGLELALRIVGGMTVLLCVSMTTPLPELMRAARFFRFSPLLVELSLIVYRYLFLLFEEGQRIRNAQVARLGYVNLRTGLKSSGILGGMLLLRSYDRAERNMLAMRARGYRGTLPAVAGPTMARRDLLALCAGLTLLMIIFLLR